MSPAERKPKHEALVVEELPYRSIAAIASPDRAEDLLSSLTFKRVLVRYEVTGEQVRLYLKRSMAQSLRTAFALDALTNRNGGR